MTEISLWADLNGPTSYTASAARETLSTEFVVTTGVWWLKALRIWRGTYDVTGPLYARVYLMTSITEGTPVAGTDVTITPSGLGWQLKLLPRPVALTVGWVYRAAYWTPQGATSTPNYWSW